VLHNDEKQRWNTLVSSEELKTVKTVQTKTNYLGGLGEKSKSEKNDQKTIKKPLKDGPKVSSKQVKTIQNDPKRSKEAQKCQKPSVYIINRWDDVCKTCTFYSRLALKSV